MRSESSLAKNLFCVYFFLASAGALIHEKLNLNIPVNCYAFWLEPIHPLKSIFILSVRGRGLEVALLFFAWTFFGGPTVDVVYDVLKFEGFSGAWRRCEILQPKFIDESNCTSVSVNNF